MLKAPDPMQLEPAKVGLIDLSQYIAAVLIVALYYPVTLPVYITLPSDIDCPV